jgi:hypothetical protein
MSTIIGDAEFNNSNNNGTVQGETSFNGESGNTGTVVGDAYFSDTSANNGTVDGNAAFYDAAVNSGEVTEAAAFLDEAQNNGEIGALCVSAPVITEHPQNVYTGGSGEGQIMLFSTSSGDFTSSTFSIRAEENPWIDVRWSIAMTYSYNSTYTTSVNGSYNDVKDLYIGSIGGLPSDVREATINCTLANGIGEVNAIPAIFKKGGNPSITQEASYGQITVTEGDAIIFPFNAFSWANTVTVGISTGNTIFDPVVVESEFNTDFDVNSLDGRRKIVMGQLNLGRPATLEDNNTQWWFRISDIFGSGMAPNAIYVYVNPA